MRTGLTFKIGITAMALAATAALGPGLNASAAALTSLTIGPAAPTPTAGDVYNFVGSGNDFGNVNTTSAGGYGTNSSSTGGLGGNDVYQYVSGNRPDQGQTFTTGANPTGYTLTSIWLEHVGYNSSNVSGPDNNGTYWQLGSGAKLTVRVTNPSLAGKSGFALATETYTAAGNEASPHTWAAGQNNFTGDGYWMDFVLSSPVTLQANTQYGFDVSSQSSNGYFEILGTDGSATGYNFTGGSAYNGSTNGASDNALNTLSGSRVFLASMTANPVPEPATFGLLAFGAIGLLLLKRKTA